MRFSNRIGIVEKVLNTIWNSLLRSALPMPCAKTVNSLSCGRFWGMTMKITYAVPVPGTVRALFGELLRCLYSM